MLRRRVVVTGIGVVAPPISSSLDLWNALLRPGFSSLAASRDGSHVAVDSGDIPALSGISPRELRRIPLFARYAIAAAAESLEQADVQWTPSLLLRGGVMAGSAAGGIAELEQQQHAVGSRGVDRVSPFLIPRLIVNAASGNIATLHKLQGPCLSWSAGCASGAVAIGEAFRLIQSGEADLMLAGGADAALTRAGVSSLQAAGLLPDSLNTSAADGRPFDPDSRWFTPAEGAGFLMLEALEAAQQRGARILAEISGYSSVFDPACEEHQISSAEQLCRTMRLALQDAETEMAEIDVVCAHAIGIGCHDLEEARAIAECWGSNSGSPLIVTGRSHLGHALGATGAIDAAAGICMLQHQLIPPAGRFQIVGAMPKATAEQHLPMSTSVQSLLLNSFSFGGQNACLVIRGWRS